MTAKERYQELLAIMHGVIDFDDSVLETATHTSVMIRMFISHQMRKDGFPYQAIGKAVGRHYSSVIASVKRWNDILIYGAPYDWFGWGHAIEVWGKFHEDVRQVDDKRAEAIFHKNPEITLGEFREMTADLPDGTIIRVTDGDLAGIDIKLSVVGNKLFLCRRKE